MLTQSVVTERRGDLERGKPAKNEGESQANAQEREETGVIPQIRRLFAEMLGTFLLTFVAAGGEVIAAVSHGEVSHAARVVAPGLTVMALIYAMGDASGAHFNPAVTFAFAARRDFPWARVPGYWAVQMVGASLAALLLQTLFGRAAHLGATLPRHGVEAAFVLEIVLTCLLILVILGTATRYSLVGPNAALAVGATIALCGLFAGPISGASMNPARSLGPALVGGATQGAWIYLAGPFLGSGLAALFMAFLHPKRDPEEGEAACGDEKKQSE